MLWFHRRLSLTEDSPGSILGTPKLFEFQMSSRRNIQIFSKQIKNCLQLMMINEVGDVLAQCLRGLEIDLATKIDFSSFSANS